MLVLLLSACVTGCGKNRSQGMALRHKRIQAIDLLLWGGAMRCQNFFRSLFSMRTDH